MKFSLISFLAAAGYAAAAKSNPFAPKVSANNAESAYTAKLVRGAKTVRALEGQNGQIDLTNYAIKFEKCQFVKEFAGGEEGGNNNNNGGNNFLQTKRFVIFRLCPNSSCGSCNSGFGEYITDLDTYLQATTEYVQQKQENMCQTCNQCYENQNNGGDGNDDNAYMCQNIDTSSCYEECQNIDNMEANGYIDASEFIECQQLQNNNNNNNNNGQQVNYYAGAICASSGTRIKIGVFTDNTCSTLAENMDVESMLNGDNGYMKLSYHKLKSVFPESDCVAKCLYEDENANNNNNNGEQQQAQNAEICTNLYEAAGKCESTHGFSAMKYYNNNNNNQNNAQNTYYNQIRNEEAVCNYLQNVMSGIYDMSGEISIQGGRSVTGGGPATTGGQKFALTFFILGSAGLAGYALMLHQQLTKGAKANLANQGGAMA